MSIRRSLLAAFVVAVSLSGCTDVGRNNSYVDAVNRAQNAFAAQVAAAGTIAGSAVSADQRRSAERFRTAVGAVVDQLRKIAPPKKVANLHRRLIDEISSYGDEVGRAVSSLDAVKPSAKVVVEQRLLHATTTVSEQVNATIDSINAKLKSA